MTVLAMRPTQQSRDPAPGPGGPCAGRGPLWQTAPGQPLKLAAAPGARWLRVREGELWITADGRRDAPPPEDWWLTAGHCLRLPAGTPVLLEGWPMARFELLEEASRDAEAAPAPHGWPRARALARRGLPLLARARAQRGLPLATRALLGAARRGACAMRALRSAVLTALRRGGRARRVA